MIRLFLLLSLQEPVLSPVTFQAHLLLCPLLTCPANYHPLVHLQVLVMSQVVFQARPLLIFPAHRHPLIHLWVLVMLPHQLLLEIQVKFQVYLPVLAHQRYHQYHQCQVLRRQRVQQSSRKSFTDIFCLLSCVSTSLVLYLSSPSLALIHCDNIC